MHKTVKGCQIPTASGQTAWGEAYARVVHCQRNMVVSDSIRRGSLCIMLPISILYITFNKLPRPLACTWQHQRSHMTMYSYRQNDHVWRERYYSIVLKACGRTCVQLKLSCADSWVLYMVSFVSPRHKDNKESQGNFGIKSPAFQMFLLTQQNLKSH